MNGSEFEQVASLLTVMGGEFEDGRHRSAVSRLYYAAFIQARDLLVSNRGFKFKKREAHTEVNQAFGRGDKSGRLLSQALAQLKKLREAADYETGAARDPAAVAEAKALYAKIVELFGKVDYAHCHDPASDRLSA